MRSSQLFHVSRRQRRHFGSIVRSCWQRMCIVSHCLSNSSVHWDCPFHLTLAELGREIWMEHTVVTRLGSQLALWSGHVVETFTNIPDLNLDLSFLFLPLLLISHLLPLVPLIFLPLVLLPFPFVSSVLIPPIHLVPLVVLPLVLPLVLVISLPLLPLALLPFHSFSFFFLSFPLFVSLFFLS